MAFILISYPKKILKKEIEKSCKMLYIRKNSSIAV